VPKSPKQGNDARWRHYAAVAASLTLLLTGLCRTQRPMAATVAQRSR
jgi:hypothetical protein